MNRTTANKIHISEDLVVNKTYFEPMSKELTCSICEGLLVEPVLCDKCEHPFCFGCISEWTSRNNQCIMKCPGQFKSKSITRMIKNIMEKVILECNYCKGQVSLTEYSNHIIPCEENNKLVSCPFCKECKVKRGKINDNEFDLKELLIYFPKFNHHLKTIEQDNQFHVSKLNELIKNLQTEIKVLSHNKAHSTNSIVDINNQNMISKEKEQIIKNGKNSRVLIIYLS